ncbi:hypothetical protein D9M71_653760 [compost metagenome]
MDGYHSLLGVQAGIPQKVTHRNGHQIRYSLYPHVFSRNQLNGQRPAKQQWLAALQFPLDQWAQIHAG